MNKQVNQVIKVLEDGKAQDIVLVNFENKHPLLDYFIIADAPTFRQVNALADQVIQKMEEKKISLRHRESDSQSPWVLLDFNDFVVHLFLTEERKHYNLDKLYQEYIQDV